MQILVEIQVGTPGEEVPIQGTHALTVFIPGDLDGDADTDRNDYNAFRATLGRCTGSPGFNALADYDHDGCVTNSDYRTWVVYYRGS